MMVSFRGIACFCLNQRLKVEAFTNQTNFLVFSSQIATFIPETIDQTYATTTRFSFVQEVQNDFPDIFLHLIHSVQLKHSGDSHT